MKHYYKIWSFIFCSILLFCAHQKSLANDFPPTNPIVSNPSNCDLNLLIPDQNCFTTGFTVEIDVNGLTGTSLGNDIFLREVRLIIDHEWLADLDIVLTSPNGVSVELSSDNGSSDDNYGNPDNGLCNEYTAFVSNGFADCSTISVEDGTAPFIGEFLPEGNFANFHDGSDPDAGNWLLEICDDGVNHEGILEFVELVFVSSTCATPTNISVLSVDSTSAEISWTSGNLGANAIIEFGTTGFTLGTGTQTNAITNPFIINTLNPETTYDFYIFENCGMTNLSANSCVESFTTTCSPSPITAFEDFDSEGFCFSFCGFPCALNGLWKNVETDDMDWVSDNGSTPSSFTGPSGDVSSSGRFVYLETTGSGCQNGSQAYLISPLIDVNSSGSGCDMSFNYHALGQHIGSLDLQISTDCGDNWQSIFFASGEQGNQWNFEYIDLSTYDGLMAQFRFIGTSGPGYAGDIAIDEIAFYGSTISTGGVNQYFFDSDGDGFGDDNNQIFSCDDTPPANYVAIGGDCHDQDFDINPDADEIPCDGIDNNCNGMFDDLFLFEPLTEDEEICQGQTPILKAFPQSSNGFIEWFEEEADIFPVATGTNFTPAGSQNIEVTVPTDFTFWAREREGFLCFSEKVPVTLTIYPNPSLVTQEIEPQCSGTIINLLDFLEDENNTNSTQICYNANNTQLPDCQVLVNENNHIFRVEFIAEGDCTDEILFDIDILPSPDASISGENTICKGSSKFLTATDNGNGILPISYSWSTGSSSNFTQIFSGQNDGDSNNYAVTITGNNGCSSSDNFLVETVETISNISFSINEVTVCNGQNGSIQLSISDGEFPYNVQWFGESSGFFKSYSNDTIINNLKQGYYQVQITDDDGNGCATTLPQIVINGPSATIENFQITPPNCSESADGCIEIEVSGNNPIIVWSTGEQTETICGLESGAYSVTVFDGNCSNELAFQVIPPTEIDAVLIPKEVSCFNGSDGEIEIFVSGGSGNYNFEWSNTETSQNIENLEAGNYQVTITDSKNCQQIFETEVIHPDPIGMLDKTSIDINCHGENSGLISIKPNGGISPYQIIWSNGATGFQIQNLEEGTYFTTIIDANGCELFDTTLISTPPALEINQNFNNPTCAGQEDGSIDIMVSGGIAPYIFSWNNAAVTEDLIENLAPGIYWVDVLDANNCEITSDTIELIGKEILTFEAAMSDPTCNGVADGNIDLIFHDSVNVNTLNFEWSNNLTTQNINNLPQGEYFVTVTDSDNCEVDSSFILETTTPISLSTSVINSACAGQNSGSISLGMEGDNPPFSVIWENGSSDFSQNNLAPGIYTPTITDNIGCILVDTLEIIESPAIQISEELVEHVICHGQPLGSIQIDVSGGAGGFTYQWSNGETTQDINEIFAGEYFVTVSDANNCVKVSKKFIVTESSAINISTNPISQPSCEGGTIDELCIFVNGGTSPYQLIWSNGFTETCVENPPSGDYKITVTDAQGCTEILSDLKIPETVEPLGFVFPNGPAIETICAGEGSQPFPVKIEGGTKPYQYLWSHGTNGVLQADTLWISDLEPGFCNVTITDNFGCVLVSDTLEVINVTPVFANFEANDISCFNGNDGEIQIFATGGTPNYDFYLFNAQDSLIKIDSLGTGFFENMNEGFFSAIIIDDNGCQASVFDIEINEPTTPLSMIPIEITNAQCFQEASGQISLTPSGGIAPYQFDWDSGDTTQNLIDIAAGIYEVTMTDANDCGFIQAFVVHQPDTFLQIIDFQVVDILCAGDETGSIDITVDGGWGDYSYFWTPSLSNEEDLNNLPAGNYSIVISDEMGCATSNTEFEITEPDSIFVDIQKTDTPFEQSDGSIYLAATGGTGDLTYFWNTGETTSFLEELPIGLYSVTITDENDCTTVRQIQINNLTRTFDSEILNQFSIFPTPASEQFFLEIEAKNSLDLQIEVFDIIGKKQIQILNHNFQRGIIDIEIRHLQVGTYFVILKKEGSIIGKEKLVIFD